MSGHENTPRDLILCEPPALDWSRPDTPASDSFGDIYYSVDNGLNEARAVYLGACGLPARWAAARDVFTIAELGFGTGLNFLAAWQMWTAAARNTKRLHYISVEKYPLSRDDISRALAPWGELRDLSDALIQQWPGRVRGIHRLHFGDVTLTLIHDDVLPALDAVDFAADAWFLDGFSPERNPEMWSTDVLSRVGARSNAGARIGTFTAAGAVREGLKAAGFTVERVAGYGRKRHRLDASMPPSKIEPKRRVITPIIIGGGIAGGSLARAFLRRGIIPIVIDADDDTAASGNPAAIVKPRLDRQDKDDARFFLSSYLYALNSYRALGTVLSEGVFHAAKTDVEHARFKALAEQSPLPSEHMVWQDGPFATSGLMFPRAQIIAPVKTCAAMMDGAVRVRGRVVDVRSDEEGLSVMGGSENILAQGNIIIFAAGAGIRDLPRFDGLGLRYSRGQLSWVADMGLEAAISYGGYAVPTQHGTLLGATHSRLERGDIYAPSPDDDIKNRDGFHAVTGLSPVPLERPSRVSVRVNTPQTWPAVIDFGGGISALSGLGSRGFVFAPLLGEHIVSRLCGEVGAVQRGLFTRKTA